MAATPPTEPLSRATRLLAALIIALAAFGITWLAIRWLHIETHLGLPLP